MAGYVIHFNHRAGATEVTASGDFHIGQPKLAKAIMIAASHSRVVTLQLDGDELAAALWGLENFRPEAD